MKTSLNHLLPLAGFLLTAAPLGAIANPLSNDVAESFHNVTAPAQQAKVNAAFARVKSTADLQALLAAPSILDALGDELPAFINSVEFGDGSVQFDGRLLEGNLSLSQVYQVLSLFGMQHQLVDYAQARVVSDSDKLLQASLAAQASLPLCQGDKPIRLIVTVDQAKQAHFKYKQSGIECDGNVELNESTTISYRLVHRARTPLGLKIVGAGFTNPYDAHIEEVTISDDGQQIFLRNNIENEGVSKFQFIFSSDDSNLLLVSPDPQVKNRPTT
ncbi:DP-EP family protein [Shewanella sp. Scap07]|uniref:DP-EP family protein n=1 Tax=Shewanella sp. Scap07 TaxID=2589987 RepID=UPI0015B8F7C4|nr:DP-EP family protein [Shewanella sp. Scap07]